ncbi:MAG: hypothetical protein V4613_14600, partial [Bacteroidota bacterium]
KGQEPKHNLLISKNRILNRNFYELYSVGYIREAFLKKEHLSIGGYLNFSINRPGSTLNTMQGGTLMLPYTCRLKQLTLYAGPSISYSNETRRHSSSAGNTFYSEIAWGGGIYGALKYRINSRFSVMTEYNLTYARKKTTRKNDAIGYYYARYDNVWRSDKTISLTMVINLY